MERGFLFPLRRGGTATFPIYWGSTPLTPARILYTLSGFGDLSNHQAKESLFFFKKLAFLRKKS